MVVVLEKGREHPGHQVEYAQAKFLSGHEPVAALLCLVLSIKVGHRLGIPFEHRT